ncbi:MAG: cell division protein ZipA C-terminal FtsZ-binding domain-containing protein [Gammaproteobacteria bacterium]|jgi:cell division protein ZipA
MDQFRLILILVGLVLVAVVYWITRRSSASKGSQKARALNRRRSIPLSGDVSPPERPYQGHGRADSDRSLPVRNRKRYVKYVRSANAVAGGPQALYNAGAEPEPMSVTVFVLPLTGTTFKREQVIHCLKSFGCIARGHEGYDYVTLDKNQANRVNRLFTVKDVHEPGIFAGEGQSQNTTNGLVFEMQLPGPMESVMAFERLLDIARTVATRLNGVVCDDLRNRLTRQTTLHIKDKIVDYNRKLRFTHSHSVQ